MYRSKSKGELIITAVFINRLEKSYFKFITFFISVKNLQIAVRIICQILNLASTASCSSSNLHYHIFILHGFGLRKTCFNLPFHSTFFDQYAIQGLSRVLAGVDLALQLGYKPVKINVVLMKGTCIFLYPPLTYLVLFFLYRQFYNMPFFKRHC